MNTTRERPLAARSRSSPAVSRGIGPQSPAPGRGRRQRRRHPYSKGADAAASLVKGLNAAAARRRHPADAADADRSQEPPSTRTAQDAWPIDVL